MALITSQELQGIACPVCNKRGHVCGPSHMQRGPVDSRIPVEETTMADKVELKEYEYMVGNIPTTAMLTEKMAKRLNAKPVGEASADDVENGGNTGSQRQAQLGTTDMRQATDDGVSGETTEPYRGTGSAKKRQAQNKSAGE